MDATTLISALLPTMDRSVQVQHLAILPHGIVVFIVCRESYACCPACSRQSKRAHSRYVRTIADLAWRGVPVMLRVQVRRFFCDNAECPRKVFAEQLLQLARRYARTTAEHDKSLARLGLICGGEPGARVAAGMGIASSGDTILRRLGQLPAAERVTPAPACIGIDDFALLKGHRYGTVIVDHETGEVLDILPERSSESTAAFLSGQPQVTVVTRDRSDIYANGIKAALPDAVQVADRFHLQMNMHETVVKVLDRHHQEITDATRAVADIAMPMLPAPALATPQLPAPAMPTPKPPATTPAPPSCIAPASAASNRPLSKAAQQSLDRRARRVEQYDKVVALRKQHLSIRAIRRQTRLNARTIMKYLGAAEFPEHPRHYARHTIDPFEDQLRAMWQAGEQSVDELHRRLHLLGFNGSVHMVERCVARWRKTANRRLQQRPLRRMSSRRLSWVLLRDDIERNPDEQRMIDQLRGTCQPVRKAVDHAREFRVIFQQRQPTKLSAWIAAAKADDMPREMKKFAEGLEQDWLSVKAAAALPWSNGRAEGHVNRIKMIKRQMYGRANFDLLRIRVLARGP